MKKAIYAGSFDPLTNGHLWMIKKGAELFDELVVAIGENPDKKYSFSLDDRLEMLHKTTKQYPNVQVDEFNNQYLVNYADAKSAQYILRGIRNGTDYHFEKEIMYINKELNSQIEALFLMPPRELSEISSSLVKSLVGPKGWETVVQKYVPKVVFEKFKERF